MMTAISGYCNHSMSHMRATSKSAGNVRHLAPPPSSIDKTTVTVKKRDELGEGRKGSAAWQGSAFQACACLNQIKKEVGMHSKCR